jgi:hypothetical protein
VGRPAVWVSGRVGGAWHKDNGDSGEPAEWLGIGPIVQGLPAQGTHTLSLLAVLTGAHTNQIKDDEKQKEGALLGPHARGGNRWQACGSLEMLVPAPHKHTENTDLAIIGPLPWPSPQFHARAREGWWESDQERSVGHSGRAWLQVHHTCTTVCIQSCGSRLL